MGLLFSDPIILSSFTVDCKIGALLSLLGARIHCATLCVVLWALKLFSSMGHPDRNIQVHHSHHWGNPRFLHKKDRCGSIEWCQVCFGDHLLFLHHCRPFLSNTHPAHKLCQHFPHHLVSPPCSQHIRFLRIHIHTQGKLGRWHSRMAVCMSPLHGFAHYKDVT